MKMMDFLTRRVPAWVLAVASAYAGGKAILVVWALLMWPDTMAQAMAEAGLPPGMVGPAAISWAVMCCACAWAARLLRREHGGWNGWAQGASA